MRVLLVFGGYWDDYKVLLLILNLNFLVYYVKLVLGEYDLLYQKSYVDFVLYGNEDFFVKLEREFGNDDDDEDDDGDVFL